MNSSSTTPSTSGQGEAPSDPRQKWLGIFALVLIVGGAMAISFGGEVRREMLRQALVEDGADAQATVLSLRQTGKFINDNPEVALQLRVEPEGAEAFEVELTQTIAQVELPAYQPGARVEVKYDPGDHERVVVMALIPPAPAPASSAPASPAPSAPSP